ncbi:MAG: hypothetical protein K0R98_1670 [Rickettsiaceae bacterium]|jgi:hypothetical protein|nr:hypothetical protein [Rickettsiaceae bacterium]
MMRAISVYGALLWRLILVTVISIIPAFALYYAVVLIFKPSGHPGGYFVLCFLFVSLLSTIIVIKMTFAKKDLLEGLK